MAPPPAIILNIDDTDPLWGNTVNEKYDFRNVDSRGNAIPGTPVGYPYVNGVASIPMDSSGAPLTSFAAVGCIGAVDTCYYIDYGLLLEYADSPYTNSWLVIYILIMD